VGERLDRVSSRRPRLEFFMPLRFSSMTVLNRNAKLPSPLIFKKRRTEKLLNFPLLCRFTYKPPKSPLRASPMEEVLVPPPANITYYGSASACLPPPPPHFNNLAAPTTDPFYRSIRLSYLKDLRSLLFSCYREFVVMSNRVRLSMPGVLPPKRAYLLDRLFKSRHSPLPTFPFSPSAREKTSVPSTRFFCAMVKAYQRVLVHPVSLGDSDLTYV